MPNSQSTLNRRKYGYCYCVKCIGSLRTRRTVKAHSMILQRPLTKKYRICHCSEHPLGRMVHRKTLLRHTDNDKIRGVDFKLFPGADGLEDLVDNAEELQMVEDIRAATYLTQLLAAFDDDDRVDITGGSDEADDDDASTVASISSDEDAEEDERLDAVEELQGQLEGLDFGDLPTGKTSYFLQVTELTS